MNRVFLLLLLNSYFCCSENTIIGGGCDGCELMYIGMPKEISSISYSPAWDINEKRLLITGKIYQINGVTPAANVIVYYWQTDNNGYYSNKKNLDQRAKKHGYIRGWVKSDTDGNYAIYTIKPKAYPNRNIPAHIHLSVKEPNVNNEYYLDNLVFNYDSLLTTKIRNKLENRGGSGILRTLQADKHLVAEHNLILGLNIPNYPKKEINLSSGQDIGEDFHSITPYHAWGADQGTKTCPVCRYGRYLGVMYFVNEFESNDVKRWLLFLDKLGVKMGHFLKVYFIYGNDIKFNFNIQKQRLKEIGKKLALKNVALTFVPSFTDTQSDIYLAKINPDMNNTFIIYKNRNIIGKFINLRNSTENETKISHLLSVNKNNYFNLPIDKSRY